MTTTTTTRPTTATTSATSGPASEARVVDLAEAARRLEAHLLIARFLPTQR